MEKYLLNKQYGDGEESSKDSSRFIPKPSLSEHLGKQRQYWRDIILGVNDGLISTFLLVSGVSGGGLAPNDILLTGISGALAGAVSMFAGEYMATKSQHEILSAKIKREKMHINKYHCDEVSELHELLSLIGIPERGDKWHSIRTTLIDYYGSDNEALLKIMVALEFGSLESEKRDPIFAGVISGALFLLGALPSVIPFAFVKEQRFGLVVAAICTALSLFLVGFVKSCTTGEFWLSSAIENLACAGLGGMIAFIIGIIFDSMVDSHF